MGFHFFFAIFALCFPFALPFFILDNATSSPRFTHRTAQRFNLPILDALEKPDSWHQPTIPTPGVPAMPNRVPTPVDDDFARPVSPIAYRSSNPARPVQMLSKLDLPTLTSITSTDVLLWLTRCADSFEA